MFQTTNQPFNRTLERTHISPTYQYRSTGLPVYPSPNVVMNIPNPRPAMLLWLAPLSLPPQHSWLMKPSSRNTSNTWLLRGCTSPPQRKGSAVETYTPLKNNIAEKTSFLEI